VDTDTKYLPGTGLTLAGTTFNVDEVVVRGWCYDAPTELYSLLDTRYAATAHNHDTLYYKKSEIDTMLQQAVAQFLLLLDTKADKVHAHVIADVTGLQTSLDGKAAKAHAHATTDVTGLQTAVEGWAKGVCYDTAADLATAVPGWDQNASDDLTVGTTFAGDVTGLYNNLQIASGAVGSQEIADATKYVSVQNSTSADQFAVTDGSPVLQFAGGGATTVSFDAATHRVTISSASDVDGVIGNEVTNATDGSLTRSGAGTPASPYTLAINPGFNNVWTQAQTFQIGAKFPGGGTWDPTGNLGIGTAPSYPLEVRKSADNIYAASINNTSAIGFGLEVRTSSASASQAVVEVYNGLTANLFRIGADGSVGIGTTGPTARLDVAGPIQSRAGTTSTGELRMTTTGGTQYAGFKAPTSLLSPVMLTMPTSYPLATGQVLGSDGAGNLSWVTPGTVTSVGLAMPSQFTVTNSPVTASGTLTASWVAQSPNQVLAGPATGTGTGIPAFRALVAADIPTLSTSVLGSGILPIARGGTNSTATPTLGGVVYGNGAGYSVSGAGSSTQVLKGGASNPTWGSVALATDVSGTLPAANGGTGFSTYSVGNLLVADTTSSLAKLAPVASGNVLRSEGVGVVPSWGKVNLQNHTAGVLLPGNGGTGIAVAGPAGSVAYSDGSYFAFNSQGLNGQYLKSSGTGAPVWGGIAAADLPSTSNAYIQNQVLAQQDAEFSIDGNGLIGRSLGVGTTSPTARLHVAGGTVTSTTDPMTTVDVSQTFGFAPTADVAVTGIRSVVASATQASSYQVIPQAIEGSTFVTGNAAGIEYALGVVGKTTNSSAGSLGYAYGVSGLAVNGSSGSIYSAVGVYGEASGYTGSVTTAYGGKFTAYSSVATTNVGIQAHATGGVNNYAALFTGGSVGIGTTTPQTTLDVSGSGSFSGTLTVGGAPVLTASLVQVPKGNTVTTIASVGAVATDVSSVSLTIGADGLPVASFFDWTRSSLRVAKCTNAACSSFTVPAPPAVDDPSVGNVGWYNSIAISTDGMPVISYYEDNRGAGTLQNVVVSKCASVDCSTLVNGAPYVVDSTGDVGKHTSLAIGTDGLPVIAYQDVTNTNLKVAKCGNVACTLAGTYTIDGGGRRAAIAIGTDGYPVVSYVGSAGSGLKVAKCASASCAALAAGSPTVIDADAGDLVNQYQSLTIGADGLPVLAFDSYNGGTNTWALKVAKCADAACLTQVSGSPFTVESSTTGDVARHESITVGADGLPIIAYYGVPTNSLKVVKCGNAACQSGNSIVTIDSMGAIAFNAGPCTSITIGVDGLPVIAYLTAATNSLKIAKCTNPFCIPYWTRR
jgi:hypothetical protein